MRINRLDLIAFGPFTNRSLDFSKGAEGFHIVYGKNEAGKSSALRGLRGFLYGIPRNSSDDFIHKTDSIRIGALLRDPDGSDRYFKRRKGNKNTLLAQNDAPLSDSEIEPYLRGVAAELFSQMFGISHEDLVEGGSRIVAGGGALGESLFSAGLGQNIHAILERLDEQINQQFKPAARGKATDRVNERLRLYRDAVERTKQKTLTGKEWEDLENSLDAEVRRRETLRQQLSILQADFQRQSRLQKALPLIIELKLKTEQIQNLGAVVILPPDFPEKRRGLQESIRKARTEEQRLTKQLEDLTGSIASLHIPEVLLQSRETIMSFHGRWGSTNKAAKDMTQLLAKQEEHLLKARVLLEQISPGRALETVDDLKPLMARRDLLLKLISTDEALRVKETGLSADLEQIADAIKRKTADLKARGSVKTGELGAVLKTVQKFGDLDKRVSESSTALQKIEQKAALALKKLSLWTGNIKALQAMPLPSSDTVARFERDFDALIVASDKLRAALEEKTGEQTRKQVKLSRLERSGHIPMEADLKEVRDRRNEAWAIVKRIVLQEVVTDAEIQLVSGAKPINEAYEQRVADADDMADRMLHEADRVTTKAALLDETEELRRVIAQLEQDLSLTGEKLNNLNSEWITLWKPLSVQPLGPREMLSWLKQCEQVLQLAETEEDQQLQVNTEKKDRDICVAMLSEQLVKAGICDLSATLTLSALIAQAEAAVKADTENEKIVAGLAETIRELDLQKEAKLETRKKLAAEQRSWQAEWDDAMKSLPLPVKDDPALVAGIIDRANSLFQNLEEADAIKIRIIAIQKDTDTFAAELKSFLDIAAPTVAGVPIAQAVETIFAMLTAAEKDAVRLAEWQDQLRKNRHRLLDINTDLNDLFSRITKLCTDAACKEDGFEAAEQASAAADTLQIRIAQIHEQLRLLAGGGTLEALLAEAQNIDPDQLPGILHDLGSKISELDHEITKVTESIGTTRSALESINGSDQAAMAAEEAASYAGEITEGIERYLVLKAGALLLKSRIEHYRKMAQGPILKRSGEYFSRITCGSFGGLTTFYQNDEPVLAGVRPSGGDVPVTAMSEGTRDQLYLALRLASLESYIDNGIQLPLILDDIPINFDDDRSRAAFQCFEELSRKTQIILFTHHNHLVELAKSTLKKDALFIQELAG